MSLSLKKLLSLLVGIFFLFSPITTLSATAAVATSNCVITNIGAPGNTPLPAGCASFPAKGIIYPPGMVCGGGPGGQYCQMPPSNGSWHFTLCGGDKGSTGKRWGRKEMIGILYTVAGRWHAKYPQGYLNIRDITAGNHKTHFWGVAVDLWATSNGTDRAANADYYGGNKNYSVEKTIELGKMIADTGYLYQILHMSSTADAAILKYARTSESAKRYNPYVVVFPDHWDHFHLDIGPSSFHLPTWNAGC